MNNDHYAQYTEGELAKINEFNKEYEKRMQKFIAPFAQDKVVKVTEEDLKECMKENGITPSVNVDLVEADDYIIVNSVKIYKPLLEKPINGDEHNINIYYPFSSGGGCKKLFRKRANEASKFYPSENKVRRDQSYIYEKFLPNDGFDIKIYSVGTYYAHGEARKSPTLDGKVNRAIDGKEIRYPIIMSSEEKVIARTISYIFKQGVCGFDLLRSNGKSYVCDVNGWSFVKGNETYYSDCTMELRRIILTKLGRQFVDSLPPRVYLTESTLSSTSHPLRPNTKPKGHTLELRSVVSIFRHGDRTPKQKMKLIVNEPEFMCFFATSLDPKLPKALTLKTPKLLQTLLDNTEKLLVGEKLEEHEMDHIAKLSQLKNVLARGGHFEGINRKVELKPLKNEEITKGIYKIIEALLILKWGGELTHSGIKQAEELGKDFREKIYPYSENGGLLRLHSTYRHDLKCYSSNEGRCQLSAAAFLKGMLALEDEISPILPLISKNEMATEMLDDSDSAVIDKKALKKPLMKMLNSNEPLIDQLSKEAMQCFSPKVYTEIKKIINPRENLKEIHFLISEIAKELETLLSKQYRSKSYLINKPVKEHAGSYIGLNDFDGIKPALLEIPQREDSKDCIEKNPKVIDIEESAKELELKLKNLADEEREKVCGCQMENLVLMFKRWKKLEKDFYSKKSGLYDTSKIPDVYDCNIYDLIHNPALTNGFRIKLLFKIQIFHSIITQLEHGITKEEKINIGYKIIKSLIKKVHHDLLWWLETNKTLPYKGFQNESNYNRLDGGKMPGDIKTTWRFVRTRLYFTSASHLYSLFNIIIHGMNSSLIHLNEDELTNFTSVSQLGFLSYIVFKLYEDLSLENTDPKRFKLELAMSPGCIDNPLYTSNLSHMINIAPEISLNRQLTLNDLMNFLEFLSDGYSNDKQPNSEKMEEIAKKV